VASGCGAAYYGTALGIIASQKKTKTVDTSFPDAVPTDMAPPPFGTLVVGAEVTVQRTTAGGTSTLSGREVTNVVFPAGYGEVLSNRDAGQTLAAGDRLVVQLHGQPPQELLFDGTDAASVGTAVAAAIQRRVRALSPSGTAPAEAWTRFTASFDPTTLSYRCRSGAPGADSAVTFEPIVPGGVQPNAVSTATAARLGLGAENGDIRTRGDDDLLVTVLNRGTDVIPEGTPIELWLSHDKLLNEDLDLALGSFPTTAPVAVGEARRFSARGRGLPPRTLIREDFTPGRWYLLLKVAGSGSEQVLDNNLLVSPQPLELYQPVDDPATPATETALDLDFAFVRTASPISAVTGQDVLTRVTLANYGQVVPAGGRLLDLDLILSADQRLDEPALLADPAGALAGLIVNPTDPARPVTVRLVAGSAAGGVSVAVAADLLTATYDANATVSQLVTALNGSAGGLVDAREDGRGNPQVDTVVSLVSAAAKNELAARDVFLGAQRVTFPETDRPAVARSFELRATIRSTAFKSSALPVRLFPFFRLRLVQPGGETAQNARNDVRQGANYVRVYERPWRPSTRSRAPRSPPATATTSRASTRSPSGRSTRARSARGSSGCSASRSPRPG
jgi:hypothetical protein